MNARKTYRYCLICLIIIGIMNNISGCGNSRNKIDTASVPDASTDNSMTDLTENETGTVTETESGTSSDTESTGENTTVQTTTDGIFRWSSEDYFYLLEGEWRAVEYAGAPSDSHDDSTEEDYWEKEKEYTNEAIEKNLGSEFNITRDNLEYFGPYSDFTIVMEDNLHLMFNTQFNPGIRENISLTPPYIGLCAKLADKGEYYYFIIDAEGTVLIKIDYCFFRLERIEECES